MAAWKQLMMEKIGKAEITGDSPEIRQQAALMEDIKQPTLKTTKRVQSAIGSEKDSIKEHKAFADTLMDIGIKTREHPELGMVSQVLSCVGEYQATIEELRAKRDRQIYSNVNDPLEIVLREIKAGEAAEAKFNRVRLNYDASVQKLASLRKAKNPNQLKIDEAEQEVMRNKQQLETVGKETLETLIETNSFSETEIIDRMNAYLETQREFFERSKRALDRLTANTAEWTEYTEKRREDLKRAKTRVHALTETGPARKKTEFFGTSLVEIAEREQGAVPRFLMHSLAYLEAKGMNEVGLFRVAASKTQSMAVVDRIDEGKVVDYFAEGTDATIVSDCIKFFLRELPEPLLTFERYGSFIAVNNITDRDTKTSEFRFLLSQLPPYSFQVAAVLMRFLDRVAANSEVNKMGAANLATIFAPSILYPKEQNPATMVEEMSLANMTVATLIQQAKILFPDSVVTGAQAVYMAGPQAINEGLAEVLAAAAASGDGVANSAAGGATSSHTGAATAAAVSPAVTSVTSTGPSGALGTAAPHSQPPLAGGQQQPPPGVAGQRPGPAGGTTWSTVPDRSSLGGAQPLRSSATSAQSYAATSLPGGPGRASSGYAAPSTRSATPPIQPYSASSVYGTANPFPNPNTPVVAGSMPTAGLPQADKPLPAPPGRSGGPPAANPMARAATAQGLAPTGGGGAAIGGGNAPAAAASPPVAGRGKRPAAGGWVKGV